MQASPTYLVPQEDMIHTPSRMIPNDQQASAIPNEDLGRVHEVSLERLHRA